MIVIGHADSQGNPLNYTAQLDPCDSSGYHSPLLAKLLIQEGLVKGMTTRKDGTRTLFEYRQPATRQSGQEFLAAANAKQKQLTDLMDEYDRLQAMLKVHEHYVEDKKHGTEC